MWFSMSESVGPDAAPTSLGAPRRAPEPSQQPTIRHAALDPLVRRLRAAYAREARPDEIEGAEAGEATGENVYEFIHEDQDPEELEELLRRALQVPDAELGIEAPLVITRREWDCERAPCLAVLEVEGDGDLDCSALYDGIIANLDPALPIKRDEGSDEWFGFGDPMFDVVVRTDRGCRFGFQTWTEGSARRAQSISEGMWGFIEGMTTADMERMNKLWPGFVEPGLFD
jgi:hypothetical protein